MRTANILAVILVSVSLKAQVNIFNLSLRDSSKNIFYIGVDNIIKISGKDYNPSKGRVAIAGGGGSIYKTDNGTYIIKVQVETELCHIFYRENDRLGLKKQFTCKNIESPLTGRLGGIKDSTASINNILLNPFLHIDIPGSYYNHRFFITNFSAAFIGQDFDSLKTNAVGNLLSKEQIELIKQLKPGDRIFFHDIYAVGPDSRRRKLTPFSIYIK
jgi:hypothetical protein